MTTRARATSRRSSAIRTFLIADIRGYTRFTDQFGDEAASRLASTFAQIVAESMEAWGGRLVELRGDEALCTFDSPRAALRCALELQQTFAEEAAWEPALPLHVGIGLDVGEAVPVGDGYRGAALNLAARLCSGAAAGEIRATQNLAHVAGPIPGLIYEPQDTEQLKGVAAEVAIVRVRPAAEVPAPSRATLSASARSAHPLPPELETAVPLVGRQSDLLWLRWYWRRARLGHGGSVEVAGDAGMGKTRLVAELGRLVLADGGNVRLGTDAARTVTDQRETARVVVFEDVDRAPASTLEAIDQLESRIPGEPVLLVSTRREPSDAQNRPQRVLEPLTEAEVAGIAQLYAGEGADPPPALRLLEESGGIPLAVHRAASQWARAAAILQMGDSARRTSRERRGLREAEEELIGRYADLELTRERSRRYGAGEDGDGFASASGPDVCPYKGLAAYEAADTEYYFGRERLIGELVARVVGSSFVGLVGASGSGKSSVLSAGLLPALAAGVLPGSREWIQVPMRPGTHPMRAMADALRRADGGDGTDENDAEALLERISSRMSPAQRLLLVIDQFEEVFTADEAERDRFLHLITEGRPGMKVVLAVRADQYERCAEYPRLARQLASEQVLVGPLRSEEVAAIVRHPAERTGLRVEPELVEALIADLGTEPGAMPLLSTALLELWEARDEGRLTVAAYRGLGGVRGAVARLAESAFARLEPEEQEAARSLFLRLIGEGSEPETIVRRRLSSGELDTIGDPRVAPVIEKLTAGRLLTRDEGTIEIAHEALIREWPRLRGWIEADAAGRQLRLHLIGSARTWEAGGREEGDLYRGARLAAALDWSSEHAGELNATEQDFLHAGRSSAEHAAERQRRTNRILRGLLTGAAVLLLAAVGAGAFAWIQAGENAENASVSQVREMSLTALSLVSEDPELALLLASEAVSMSREAGRPAPPQALQALWSAYTAGKSTTIVPGVGSLAVAYSPDGSTLAVDAPERDDALITLRDPSTGEEIETVPEPGDAGEVQSIAYSPDGRWLAVATSAGPAGGEGSVMVFEASTLALVHRLSGGHLRYDNLSLVDPGLLAASGTSGGDPDVDTLVWDVVSGGERAILEEFGVASTDNVIHSTRARTSLMLPGTEQVVLGLMDVISINQAGIVGVNLSDDSVLRCPPCPDVRAAWHELIDITADIISANPQGDRIAVADVGRGRVTIIDLVQGVPLFEAVAHDNPRAFAWNAEGSRLAVAGGESGVAVLDAASGALRLRIPSRGEPVASVSFRPGSDELAMVTLNGDLRIHRMQPTGGDASTAGRQPVDIGVTDQHLVMSLRGESRLDEVEGVGAPSGGGIAFYDRDSGAAVHERDFVVDAWLHAQVAKDAGEVAAIAQNGSSALVEAGSLREAARLPGCLGPTGISADGRYLVFDGQPALGGSCGQATVTSGIYERSGTAPLIDYGSERLRYGAVSNEVGPDGRRYAAVTVYADASDVGRLDVWEIGSQPILASMSDETHSGFLAAHVSFSPDARYLAVGSEGPRAIVIDVEALAAGSTVDEAIVFDREVHASRAPKAVVTDSGLLATSGGDGVYRFWDLGSGEMTFELEASGLLGTGSFDFSPDFRFFYYEDGGGIIRRMPVDTDDMVALAESSASRSLTDAECREFLHTDGCEGP